MRSFAIVSIVFVSFAGCDSGADQGTHTCPQAGAVFVEDGPQGSACYCTNGTVPNAVGDACVASACGEFRAPDAAGDCVDIDECAAGTAGCDIHATCANVIGAAARCTCNSGYSGDGQTCTAGACGPFAQASEDGCVDIDECAEGTAGCDLHATCTNVIGAAPRCTCQSGYAGDGHTCTVGACGPYARPVDNSCVDIDECAEGTAGCAATATCTNHTNAAPTCTCPADSVGDGTSCTPCAAGSEPKNGTCQDIDECTRGTDSCAADATCTDKRGGFTCTCAAGFIGDGTTCARCGSGLWPDDAHTTCVPDVNPCAHGGVCSSLADPDGPYPHMQCAGTIGPEQIWLQTHQKTSFPVDCRCPHGSEPGGLLCAAPTAMELANLHLGAGVNAADAQSGELKGCATDFTKKVIYYGANWGDQGDSRRAFVFAMDPATADRTLISGQYEDPSDGIYERGAGEHFDTILDMQLGPDGYLYVFEDSVPGTTSADTSPLFGRSIYRVDLTSGDRELWWNDRDTRFSASQCGSNTGDHSVHPDIFNHQFELDEQGNFFMTIRGNGIIRVANDRSKCDWITSNDAGGPGTGYAMPALDSGWAYKDGVIYGTSFFGGIYKVNVATGNRSRIYGGPVGSGPGPGVWQFLYLPYLHLWIAGGNEAQTASNAALFDPATGETWGWMYQQPDAETGGGSGGQDTFVGPAGTNRLRGPILGTLNQTLIDRPWCLSPLDEDRIFVATDRIGITIVELETGNTMNFSQ